MKKRIKRLFGVFLVAIMAVSLFATPVFAISSYDDLSKQIGVCHAAGNYNFTKEPYLIEGAKAIRNMGSKTIKLFLQHPREKYRFNTTLPNDEKIPNIVDVLKTTEFKKVLNMDFTTYVLQTHLDTADSYGWVNGLSAAEKKKIQKDYYDSASYLLKNYKNKTFILEHWEAELYFQNCTKEAGIKDKKKLDTAWQGFLDYFTARTAGVEQAKKEIKSSSSVYSSVELIWISKPATYKLINCLDKVSADLIGYSMSDDCGSNTDTFIKNLKLLKQKTNRKFYIGECAIASSEYPGLQKEIVMSHLKNALDMGSEFFLVWQIFDNEIVNGKDRGFGLITRKNEKTPLYDELAKTIKQNSLDHEAVVTAEYFKGLGTFEKWLIPEGATARGAVIHNLKEDFIPPSGWVIHTSRKPNGDTICKKGESMSVYIPDNMPAFLIE